MLTKDDLIEYMASGCKPREKWRMGLEHEQFAFDAQTGRPLPYDGEPGIKQILETIAERFDWQKKYEGNTLIALSKGQQSITLEPAGQIELSGAPHATVAAIVDEHQAYSEELGSIAKDLNIAYLSIGVHPNWSREDMHWMPKERYKIMRRYLATRGNLGLDMMTRTCGAQINLDFESERDMVNKLRVSTALQPIIIALLPILQWSRGRIAAMPATAPISGAIPTLIAAACCRLSSKRAWDSNAMSIICWMCRCSCSSAMVT